MSIRLVYSLYGNSVLWEHVAGCYLCMACRGRSTAETRLKLGPQA